MKMRTTVRDEEVTPLMGLSCAFGLSPTNRGHAARQNQLRVTIYYA